MEDNLQNVGKFPIFWTTGQLVVWFPVDGNLRKLLALFFGARVTFQNLFAVKTFGGDTPSLLPTFASQVCLVPGKNGDLPVHLKGQECASEVFVGGWGGWGGMVDQWS